MPPSAPPALSPSSERIQKLSLEDADTLLERQRRCDAEAKSLSRSIDAAVKAADYAQAAQMQARQAELTAQMSDLKEARVLAVKLKKQRAREASGAAMGLPEASQMARESLATWNAQLAEACQPLNPQVDTVLILLADAFKVAASEGIGQVRIRRAPDPDAILDNEPLWDPSLAANRAEHDVLSSAAHHDSKKAHQAYLRAHEKYLERVRRALGLVEYVVDVGFCWIPVGRALRDGDGNLSDAESAESAYATWWSHHRAVAGFPAETELDSFVALADLFDGDATHNAEDVDAVLTSELGRMLLRWKLHGLGYASRAYADVARLTHEFHKKNHATPGRLPADAAHAAATFRSSAFRAFNHAAFVPAPGQPLLVVAHGEAGARLARENVTLAKQRGSPAAAAEAHEGFAREDGAARTFAEYAEFVALAAADPRSDLATGYLVRRDIPSGSARQVSADPKILHAAGSPGARNLCARAKFQRHRREAGAAPTALAANPAPVSSSAKRGGGGGLALNGGGGASPVGSPSPAGKAPFVVRKADPSPSPSAASPGASAKSASVAVPPSPGESGSFGGA